MIKDIKTIILLKTATKNPVHSKIVNLFNAEAFFGTVH